MRSFSPGDSRHHCPAEVSACEMDNISTAEWSLDVNTTINTAGHRAVDTAAGWQQRCQIVPQLLTLRDSADDVAVCCG